MPRVIVPLTEEEYEALLVVAQVEKRDPRDQVALWARQRLEQTFFLAPLDVRALAADAEQLHGMIRALQISVGNLHTEIGEMKRQIAALATTD